MLHIIFTQERLQNAPEFSKKIHGIVRELGLAQAGDAEVLLAVYVGHTLPLFFAELLIDHVVEAANFHIRLFDVYDSSVIVQKLSERESLYTVINQDYTPFKFKGPEIGQSFADGVPFAEQAQVLLASAYFAPTPGHIKACVDMTGGEFFVSV